MNKDSPTKGPKILSGGIKIFPELTTAKWVEVNLDALAQEEIRAEKKSAARP